MLEAICSPVVNGWMPFSVNICSLKISTARTGDGRHTPSSVVCVTPEDVRLLARSAPERWSELEIVHRSDHLDVRATLRHGELDGVRLSDGSRIRERGAPPSSWSVRPLEPYATQLRVVGDARPYELGDGVEISDVRSEGLFGRPVVTFVARAVPGYDPVCSCCPLVLSEISQRLEHGDDWRAQAGELPDGVDLALDLEVGIVVSSRHRGGRLRNWFTNEIVRAV